MGRLDTWNPEKENLREEEVDSLVETLAPAPADMQRRMDDLIRSKKYVEAEKRDKQGKCNFCDHATTREFCSRDCETKAVYATMGKSLKFHE